MALVTGPLCVALLDNEDIFSLENPEHNVLWMLPQVLVVFDLPGVASVFLKYAAYGTLHLKPTIILHKLPTLYALAKPLPLERGPTVELKGWVKFEGKRTASMLLALAYPPDRSR